VGFADAIVFWNSVNWRMTRGVRISKMLIWVDGMSSDSMTS